MSATPDVSIIIVNWNGKDLLRRCLTAVEQTLGDIDAEIFVVDNASTDGSQAMVRGAFPRVRLIENSENLGFAGANNQAMRLSRGRYVLLLNSDAFVREGTIPEMVAFMDRTPDAGVASCKLLYEDGSLQRSCYAFPTLWTEFCIAVGLDKLFPRSRWFGQFLMTYWDYDDVRPVDGVMGAFMLVRAAALSEVGLMDEQYFMYSEEVDWCYRFRQKGWKTYFYPYVDAVHLWGGSTRQVRVEMLVQLYRSRTRFFRKFHGHAAAALLKAIIGLNGLLRVGPGLLYYRLTRTPSADDKLRAFSQLLRELPGF